MNNPDEALLKDLLNTFRTEAVEHVQTLNQALLELERLGGALNEQASKRCQELMQTAFRAAHSLKGAARAVSFGDVETLAHGLENVLHGARDKRLVLDPVICDVLYEALDAIQQLLQGQPIELAALQKRLADIDPAGNGAAALPEAALDEIATVTDTGGHAEPNGPDVHPEGESHPVVRDEVIRVAVGKLDEVMAQVGELLVSRMSVDQHLTDLQDLRRQLTQWPRSLREIKTLLSRTNGDTGRQLVVLFNRHDEQMQSLIREINSLHQVMNRDTLRLGMITTDLRDSVRRMRMLPFESIMLPLQRAVRDAARSEHKQVELVVQGGEVELDKKVLDMLKDPLLHLLRNAVSHGIENPETRQALGKPCAGRITIAVQQRGSEIRVAVSDDGRGFDLAALCLASARQGGPILGEDANPGDIISLAFLPGVTTAPQVSALAGRGVGLDVVRRCLEAIQGRVLVDSIPGNGTNIQLLVPTSVMMTRGLMVRVGSECYMLPLLSVEKIVELTANAAFTIEGRAAIRLDGKALPLASLATVLNREAVSPSLPGGHKLPTTGGTPAVIVSVAEQRAALLVDEIVTEQEVAVVPLGKLLRRVRNVMGAALLGSGTPIVMLNTANLVKLAKDASARCMPLEKPNGEVVKPPTPILVVDDSITTRTLETNILEAAGYQVLTATDGLGALKQLSQLPVELVVADVQMPNMNGFELVQHLRESAEYRNLPIVLVTSLESREDRERGMVAGADAYIVKRGFDQAELLATIQRLL